MKHLSHSVLAVDLCLLFAIGVSGQTQRPAGARSDGASPTVSRPVEPDSPGSNATVTAGPQAIVPRLMKFSGVLHDAAGKPLSGTVDVTFSLYSTEAGGNPLWFETQSVQADELGRYTALLGAMHTDGLPIDLFTSGEVRWLGIQVGLEAEQQPRVLLVSVPYALKAGDAETLGGKALSDFMLKDTLNTASGASGQTSSATTSSTGVKQAQSTTKASSTNTTGSTPVTTAGGTVNYVPLWDSTSDITKSAISQSNGNIGIGTTTPIYALQIVTNSPGNGIYLNAQTFGAGYFLARAGTLEGFFSVAGQAGGFSGAALANDAVFGAQSAPSNGNLIFTTQNAAGNIKFATGSSALNDTTKMIVTNAGNVGIGTSAPAAKLDVESNSTSQIVKVLQTGAGNGLVASTSGSGNFGVVGQNTATGSMGGIGVLGEASSPNSAGGYFVNTGGGDLIDASNCFPCKSVFNVYNDGTVIATKLGIGTASPSFNLDVSGNARFSGTVSFAGGQTFPGAASLGSNMFAGNQAINATGTALSANGTGTGSIGVLGTNNDVAGGSGVAGDFINTTGGRILVANDGNNDQLSVDNTGVQVKSFVNTVPNDATVGTVLNELAKFNPAGTVSVASAGDLGGVLGVVVAGAGTSGTSPNATVAFTGTAQCVFDNTAVEADYVTISATTAGNCHDAGPTYPSAVQVLGRVIEFNKTPPRIYLFGTEVRQGTGANCSSSASPAVCGSASAGSVAIPGMASTIVVDTTAVTAKSQIMLQEDSSLSSKLGVSCLFSGRNFAVTARNPGTSFTISLISTFANTACLSYVIIN